MTHSFKPDPELQKGFDRALGHRAIDPVAYAQVLPAHEKLLPPEALQVSRAVMKTRFLGQELVAIIYATVDRKLTLRRLWLRITVAGVFTSPPYDLGWAGGTTLAELVAIDRFGRKIAEDGAAYHGMVTSCLRKICEDALADQRRQVTEVTPEDTTAVPPTVTVFSTGEDIDEPGTTTEEEVVEVIGRMLDKANVAPLIYFRRQQTGELMVASAEVDVRRVTPEEAQELELVECHGCRWNGTTKDTDEIEDLKCPDCGAKLTQVGW